MAIKNITPKLFYKSFPYKVVLKRGNNTVRQIEKDLIASRLPWKRVKAWGEPIDRWYMSDVSQRDHVINNYAKFVLEMSSPHSEGHLQAMIKGETSIVRDRKYFSTYKYAIKFSNIKGWKAHGEKSCWLLKTLCRQGLHPGVDYELRRRIHLILYTNQDDLVVLLKLYHSDSILEIITIKQPSDFL